jgi:2-iminobutanoate/2-iminopropanoate deaminase
MKSITSALFTVCMLFTPSLTVGLIAGIFSVSVSAQPQPKSTSNSPQKPFVEYLNLDSGQNYPFSDAVRVGDWLILSGRIGTDASGKVVAGGIEAETKQTMERIGVVLKANGASFDDVVKCTVMLTDMKEWPAMNVIYRTYFKPDRMPARSALGVNGLALGARVEIECWAVLKSRR